MDSLMKFYLLAEEVGWDCSPYAFNYFPKIFDSDAYKILSVNVLSARNELSKKAEDICTQYDTLNKEPKTLAEVFKTEITVNYLALHSFPEYYINPLMINPNYSGELSTIGELIFDVQGDEMPLNSIILDETIPLEVKKEHVNRQLNLYLEDMNELVNTSILSLERTAFEGRHKHKDQFWVFLSHLGFFVYNFLLFFFFIFPSAPFREAIYELNYTYSLSYLAFLCPISVYTFDFFFLLYYSYKSKISEKYNYARKFLRKNSNRVFDGILKKKEELYSYISGAINNRILLNNDIKDFSMLSTSYVDLEDVLSSDKLKKKTLYQIYRSLVFVFGTICGLITLLTLVLYLISYFIDVPI